MSAQPHEPYEVEVADLDRRSRELIADLKAEGRTYDAQWPGMTRAEVDEQARLDTFGQQMPSVEDLRSMLARFGMSGPELDAEAERIAADAVRRRDAAVARRAEYRTR